jgi:SAM-dependent methyltransferase
MLRYFWRRYLADRLSRSVALRLAPELEKQIAEAVAARGALMQSDLMAAVESKMAIVANKPWKSNLHIPAIGVHPPVEGPFMAYSTCCARDFYHPEFTRLSSALGLPLTYHRKYWEWVFVMHHAVRTGAVAPGKRALGFAVGSEPLPSAFAQIGADVTATDAPEEIAVGTGWQKTGEHAGRLNDLYHPGVVDRERFEQRVSFKVCDMTNIPSDLNGFDFCWSSCSFEHLGTIEAGLDFVVESVEKTLRPGGVACHTTELNLVSDKDTVEAGATVLYRKKDLLGLIDRLQRRGHRVEPFNIAPDTHVLDFFVDTPPYLAPPHLKLQLLGYVSTSVGLIIHRGP